MTVALTPWGIAQTSEEIAPGIVFHSTASHGGYELSPARVASMPKPLREFQPWAGPRFYEEDCDWAVVALAFPQFFPADAQAAARKTLERYKPEVYRVFGAGRVKREEQSVDKEAAANPRFSEEIKAEVPREKMPRGR